jgi:hypothetical protein
MRFLVLLGDTGFDWPASGMANKVKTVEPLNRTTHRFMGLS